MELKKETHNIHTDVAAPKAYDGGPFEVAAKRGDVEIMRTLLGWFEDLNLDIPEINPRGRNPLCVASYEGHLPIVKFLLEAGFNPNITDKLASLPLFSAGGPDMMELLLKGEHLILLLDKEDKESTMELVAWRRQLASFKFLTDRGFHFSAQCSPSAFERIARAACESQPLGTGNANDMFDALLSYGVDINTRDHYGDTALWKVCARDNNFECIEYLLKKGADPFIPNENGENPFFFYEELGHTWLMLQHVNIRDMSRDDLRREIDEFVTDAIEFEEWQWAARATRFRVEIEHKPSELNHASIGN